MWPFKLYLIIHIVGGATGLGLFWVPVLSRKGGSAHRYWGRLFSWLMMVTAGMALCMGVCTLLAPLATHPNLKDPAFVAGVFGWMMIYLAILTVSLAWHGLRSVRNRRQHAANRAVFDVALQLLVIAAAINCIWQGLRIDQPLMLGMPFVGIASAGTNLWFVFRRNPAPDSYLMEHVKALVGTGISVYTAFTAFGAVHLLPQQALSPVIWSVPLLIGSGLIVYHWGRIRAGRGARVVGRPLAPGA